MNKISCDISRNNDIFYTVLGLLDNKSLSLSRLVNSVWQRTIEEYITLYCNMFANKFNNEFCILLAQNFENCLSLPSCLYDLSNFTNHANPLDYKQSIDLAKKIRNTQTNFLNNFNSYAIEDLYKRMDKRAIPAFLIEHISSLISIEKSNEKCLIIKNKIKKNLIPVEKIRIAKLIDEMISELLNNGHCKKAILSLLDILEKERKLHKIYNYTHSLPELLLSIEKCAAVAEKIEMGFINNNKPYSALKVNEKITAETKKHYGYLFDFKRSESTNKAFIDKLLQRGELDNALKFVKKNYENDPRYTFFDHRENPEYKGGFSHLICSALKYGHYHFAMGLISNKYWNEETRREFIICLSELGYYEKAIDMLNKLFESRNYPFNNVWRSSEKKRDYEFFVKESLALIFKNVKESTHLTERKKEQLLITMIEMKQKVYNRIYQVELTESNPNECVIS